MVDPAAVLRLQRLAGNRAATAQLQRHTRPAPTPAATDRRAAVPAQPTGPVAATPTAVPATVEVVSPVAGRVVQRGLLDSIAGGVSSLAGGVRDRVLGTLTGYARRVPGYDLLCTALGRDLLTSQPRPRTAENLIGGLLGLVPGGAAVWENLQRSGAVARAAAWFETQIPSLGLSWDAIRGLFRRAWDALSITDLANPAGAWARLSGIFLPPIQRLLAFGRDAVGKVMEFVFEGVLTSVGGSRVMDVMRRAGDVITTIVRNPVGFAGSLVAAVRTGLGQFGTNILNHLRNGLFAWLTGALRGAIRIPTRFDWRGILSFVMDLLGLSWNWLRARLTQRLGEPLVRRVETAVDWVRTLVTGGIGAVADRLSDLAGGFMETVIGGIRDWAARTVVGAALTRLVSMFNPAGAVIQAILAVYNTVQFFIERAQQLGALAESVFNSIGAIASGNITNAANAVEQALGRAVPVVLGFLARLIGLGDVATPVRNVVTRLRGMVDRAADRVIGWITTSARRLAGRVLGRGGAEQRRPPDGSVIATAATTAAGHHYEGRAVVAGGGLQVMVQRALLPAAPAAAASAAATASLPAREQLNRLIRSVTGLQRQGTPTSPERVGRINALLRQIIQEDLATAAALNASVSAPLGAHVTEFNGIPPGDPRREAYYMSMISWPTVTAAIIARDAPRIEAQVRRLAVGWVNGEDAIEEFRESLLDIRIGSESADDERVPGMPKYVPVAALNSFSTAAASIRRADRTGASVRVDSTARRAAVDDLCRALRTGGFDVDHRTSLARHWNTIGHRSTAEVRARIASDPDNLVAVSLNWNRSKGGEGHGYTAVPAAGFTRNLGETPPPTPVPPAPAAAPPGGVLAPPGS